jgi:hypothetical protein
MIVDMANASSDRNTVRESALHRRNGRLAVVLPNFSSVRRTTICVVFDDIDNRMSKRIFIA